MKVVLDTNVILAAFATHGLCESVMALCLDQHDVVLSQPILDEAREHLSGKFKLPAARVEEILGFLKAHREMVTPADVPANACRDADDRAVLGTASAAQAEFLITGDKDLLSLASFQKIALVSPREFYERVPTFSC